MANVKLEDISSEKRKAVQLIAEIGGFGDDYHAVNNTNFSDYMFLYNLNGAIENKRYKSVIGMLKSEYPFMNFEKENGVISDDEKLLRRTLRGMGYSDGNFFNPKYDKGDLIAWDGTSDRSKVFKVASVHMDSGSYIYSLRNIETGVEHGGRLHENELREPSVVEKILYYKKQDMLEVHLFNRLVPLDKVTKEDGLALIEALKGIDIEHDNEDIREIAYAAQKGFIDMRSHFNTLVMISGSSEMINNPIKMKLKGDDVSTDEILKLEKLAKNEIENIDKYRIIHNDVKSLKKELNFNSGIEDKKLESLMVDISVAFDSGYDNLDSSKIGEAYGSAYWTIRSSHPDVFKKVEALYEKVMNFTQERDIHKLNRPDLNDLIRSADMQLDTSRKDMILFRGSRNSEFDYHSIKQSMENKVSGLETVELNVANNGFRRELYQAPTLEHGGANMGYCEGDLTLQVPKDLNGFIERLEHSVTFYCEDEDKSQEATGKIMKEMRGKLNIDTLLSSKIHKQIQNNEVVPPSEYSKIDLESEAFKSLDSEAQTTITNYINEQSDKIVNAALEEEKQKQEEKMNTDSGLKI